MDKSKLIELLNKKTPESLIEMTEEVSKDIAKEILNTKENEIAQTIAARILEDSTRAEADKDFKKSLGLRNIVGKEQEFYNKVVDFSNSVTGSLDVIIPTTIIERTLDSVKKKSDILSLVNFAPASVTKWVIASHSGTAQWGAFASVLDKSKALAATFEGIDLLANKMYALLIIPKDIAKLSLEYVDKYFSAILEEAIQDGLEYGYLLGTGKDEPIGITKKIDEKNPDGTAVDKELTVVEGFGPLQLAAARKTLTNSGKRVVTELDLICNPLDEAQYVDPALYIQTMNANYVTASFIKINKHPTSNCPEGKAILTIANEYTYGLNNIETKTYTETLALEDADLVVAKANGNGRASDNSVAVVIDVTKLKEAQLTFAAVETTVA